MRRGAMATSTRISLANSADRDDPAAEAFDNTRLTLIKEGLAERLKDVEPRAEALALRPRGAAGRGQ
jgi:hypothetical protein